MNLPQDDVSYFWSIVIIILAIIWLYGLITMNAFLLLLLSPFAGLVFSAIVVLIIKAFIK